MKAINRKLFIILSLVFIAATVIGTLSHELGHYLVAKTYGFKASISYAYVDYNNSDVMDSISVITSKYLVQIKRDEPFSDKETYDRLVAKYLKNNFWVIVGGPLQTLLTGTIGLLLLFTWQRSFRTTQTLAGRQWLVIFITLFWLRETANLVMWFGSFLLTGEISYSADEIKIARYLNLPFWLIMTIFGLIGAVVLHTVIFKFIPKQQRITFIVAGLAGGITGYILWIMLLGPVLMP